MRLCKFPGFSADTAVFITLREFARFSARKAAFVTVGVPRFAAYKAVYSM